MGPKECVCSIKCLAKFELWLLVLNAALCYLNLAKKFLLRFKEHRAAFKTNSQSSNFAKHLIEHTHYFGPIQNTMQILQRQNKGAYLNTIERYYIYAEFTKNNHVNDEQTISPNKIFETLLMPDQT
jgi:hypothetical protein